MNKKIDIKLSIAIIAILAITMGAFAWRYEKNVFIENQSQYIDRARTLSGTPVTNQQEYPTTQIQQSTSIENAITQALHAKYPDWDKKSYDISVSLEINKENHAIGRFTYNGGMNNKGDGIWFAARLEEGWTLTDISYAGYWGLCQNFEKYNFSADMTPDCWDVEKNVLVDTTNPKIFYQNGFTKADKTKLLQSFTSYIKNNPANSASYLGKTLYVKINKNIGDYLSGSVLVGGSRNISAPEFFAVKQNGNWIVVFNGQDYPTCGAISPYHFPHDIIAKCYDETIQQLKEVI